MCPGKISTLPIILCDSGNIYMYAITRAAALGA